MSFTVGLGVAAWRNMSSLNYLSEKDAGERFSGLLDSRFLEARDGFVHESFRGKKGDWDLHYLRGDNSSKTAIAVPGISSHWTCVLKFLDSFFLAGWNVCVFDYSPLDHTGLPNRKSGSSMGVKEKGLFIDAVERVYGIFPETEKLVAIGESLGAAVAFMALPEISGTGRKIDFLVWDCGFSSALAETAFLIQRPGFPAFFAYPGAFAAFLIKIFAERENLFAASPLRALKKVRTPVLFVHGKSDTVVPFSMSVKMYGKLKKYCRAGTDLYLVEGAGHLDSILVDKMTWQEKVFDFINENPQNKICRSESVNEETLGEQHG